MFPDAFEMSALEHNNKFQTSKNPNPLECYPFNSMQTQKFTSIQQSCFFATTLKLQSVHVIKRHCKVILLFNLGHSFLYNPKYSKIYLNKFLQHLLKVAQTTIIYTSGTIVKPTGTGIKINRQCH